MTADKRIDIQWLRALAALEVVVVHSDLVVKHISDLRLLNAEWYLPFGGIGVDLFFVLSGYILCMRAPSYGTARKFIVSRVRRLFPMYWFFTSLVIVTFAINQDWRLNDFELSFDSLVRSYLILPQYGFPILGVGWTLEHEMTFYVGVALGLLILGVNGIKTTTLAWVLAGLAFIGCIQGPEPGYSLLAFHLFTPYMFAFSIGWLLYTIESMSARDAAIRLALFSAIAIAAYIVADDFGEKLVIRMAVVAIIFSAFTICRKFFERDTLLNRLGSSLGDASFSIYLCHWFVLSAVGKVLGAIDAPAISAEFFRVVAVLLSLVVGIFFFYLMERPLDRWLRRLPPLSEMNWTSWNLASLRRIWRN